MEVEWGALKELAQAAVGQARRIWAHATNAKVQKCLRADIAKLILLLVFHDRCARSAWLLVSRNPTRSQLPLRIGGKKFQSQACP
jgi:hypothetical protein